jgi:prepilin-type N-terminal cleavage/methylation domain-containing protein
MRIRRQSAFTLAEMLVSIAILTLLVLIVTQIVNNASTVVTSGNKRMDVDSQARPLLDRMAVDFAQMVKRADVDYYLKTTSITQLGNDQIAFFGTVPGYYPPTGSQSPLSLVAYRVTDPNKVERLGKGLLWNSVSSTSPSMVFLPLTITDTWPAATNSNADTDYEPVAPNVFRFEYYYLLKNNTLSITPWDVGAGHSSPVGMQDVAAISVAIAAIDPKSRALLTDAQLTALAAGMDDFATSMGAGGLTAQWQSALDGTANMPRSAVAGVRLYQRHFYLSSKL